MQSFFYENCKHMKGSALSLAFMMRFTAEIEDGLLSPYSLSSKELHSKESKDKDEKEKKENQAEDGTHAV